MVDYSEARLLKIENVEFPIHILGVEAPALLGCFWCFMATLILNPIMAPFTAILFGIGARKFFLEDQRGRPLTYTSKFLMAFKFLNSLKYIFPTLETVTIPKEEYRGEN